MTSHVWRLINDKKSLWVRWIHSYKLKGRNFWDIPQRAGVSWGWRKILQLRSVIRPFVWSSIGDGRSSSAWFDKWDMVSPLSDFITPGVIKSAGFSLENTLADIIQEGVWKWPSAWYDLFPVLINCMVPTLDPGKQDRLVWRTETGKEVDFVAIQVWEAIRHMGAEIEWVNLVWFLSCIPRHSFLLWLVLKQKLKTHDRLKPWDVGRATNLNLLCCSLRKSGLNSHNHLFFDCSFSSQVWLLIKNMADLGHTSSDWDVIVDCLIQRSRGKSVVGVIGRLVLAATVYFIWQERNNRLFTSHTWSPAILKDLIVKTIRLCMATIKFKGGAQVHKLLDMWKLSPT